MGQVGGQGSGPTVHGPVTAQHQIRTAEGGDGGHQDASQGPFVLDQLSHVAVAVSFVTEGDPNHDHPQGGHITQDRID